MSRRKNHIESGNLAAKSEAEKLKERLTAERGKRFKRLDFHPIDPEGLILERTFHESSETVQVHLTRNRKLTAVYLLRSQ